MKMSTFSTIFMLFLVAGTILFIAVGFCSLFLLLGRPSQIFPNGYVRASLQSTEGLRVATRLENLVFGIGAGAGAWEHRKGYLKLWWRPNETRGVVSLDGPVRDMQDPSLPELRVWDGRLLSEKLRLRGKLMKDQVRITRLPSELFRMSFTGAHWFILSDDDTFFVVDNLVKVLSKYDHRQFYYVGMFSESHYQTVKGFSTNMAFGGAGIALSYALVEALEKMQDGCLQRHERIWGVDGKLQACMGELGVPLTVEKGFHQLDVHGDISGLLSSHPTTPLVSLHHIDSFQPIFPGKDRVGALEHLSRAVRVDSAGVLQQSFCYNKMFNWTLKVAWGYAVEVRRGLFSPREMEHPLRTFVEWFGCQSDTCFNFRTREVPDEICARSTLFFMSNVSRRDDLTSDSSYVKYAADGSCKAKTDGLGRLKSIVIRKDHSLYEAPRRQCCSIVDPHQQEFHELRIRDCKRGEYTH